MRRHCALFFVFLALLFGHAFAQTNLYRLPDGYVRRTDDLVQITALGKTHDYVVGLGWLSGELNGSPIVSQDGIYVTPDLLAELGIELPRLAELRSSNGDKVRIVFELSGVAGGSYLASQERGGQVGPGIALELSMPQLLLPAQLPDNVHGIDLSVVADAARTRAYLSGPPMRYEVFTLENPTRLVVDAVLLGPAPDERSPALAELHGEHGTQADLPLTNGAPDGDLALDLRDEAALEDRLENGLPESSFARTLRPGVTYRRMTVPNPEGRSVVDILEIAPGYGEFRVVGESYVPRTLSELVSGGFAGINASYFDTSNRRTIGLLKVDHALLSLPNLNRASIGFGEGMPVVARTQAQLNVRINGTLYYSGNAGENRIHLYTGVGQQVGTPSQGAIVVQNGRVIENKVAPRQVPQNGFIIVYDPSIRELALVDKGDLAALEADFQPDAFDLLPYAVEAGPLLVSDGRPAYAPKLENFDIENPLSPVNRRTTRAAVGIRPDGTVLMVTATSMTTEDLVPLFMSLGASEALQMDSGGSSTLFAGGRVLNRSASSQREIATAIVFIPTGETASREQDLLPLGLAGDMFGLPDELFTTPADLFEPGDTPVLPYTK